jgi:hypothetical protein
MYQNLNEICNILCLEHLIYGLYACTCEFSLCRESFDEVLYNNPPFYNGGVTPAPEEEKFQVSPPTMALSHSLTHSLVVPPEALVAVSRLRVRGEQVVASGGPAEGLKGGTGGELIFLIKLIIKHK